LFFLIAEVVLRLIRVNKRAVEPDDSYEKGRYSDASIATENRYELKPTGNINLEEGQKIGELEII